MEKTRVFVKTRKVRAYFIAGVLFVALLGTVFAAWSWERSGNNFSLSAGRVFIGVNAPTSSHGGDANAYLQVHNPEGNPNNLEVARFTAKVTGDKSSYITVGDAVLDRKGTQGYLAYSPGGKKWSIGTHFYGPTLTIKSMGDGGSVGIGNPNPGHPLHLASGAHVTSGGVWTNASSRAYKENIEDLSPDQAQAAFSELKPVVFNYRSDPTEGHVGFIAEDVPTLLAGKDRKGVSALDVVAVLTKVVQEQQKLIAQQRETVARLAERIEMLEGKN
jgi:hypothetical protein